MINPILTHILKSPNAKDFLEWYIKNYNSVTTVTIFKDLPFELQIGSFLKYLEERWGFSIIADNTSYIAYYTSGFGEARVIPLSNRFKNNNFYHIHSVEGEPKDVVYYYALGITNLFDNLDIPF